MGKKVQVIRIKKKPKGWAEFDSEFFKKEGKNAN